MPLKFFSRLRTVLPSRSASAAILLFLSLSLPLRAACGAEEPARKKILLLHSYHAEYEWVESITHGARSVLSSEPVDFEIFYMDTKRNTTQNWKDEISDIVRSKIDTWKPDAVIACDDNAQLYVTQRYAGKKPFFVFCGVNADPADYGLPCSNVTGVIERPHFDDSVQLLRQFIPKAKNILLISDDDPTSRGTLDYIARLPIKRDFRIVDCFIISFFPRWKQIIQQSNQKADALAVYTYHTVRDTAEGKSLPPKTVLSWTVENSTVPTLGFLDFGIQDGLLCGVVESGEEHGAEAARMALALVNGADIKTLPVKTASKGLRMFNLRTAKRLNITIPDDVLKTAEKVFR